MEVFWFSKGPWINSWLVWTGHFLSFFLRILRLLTKARQHHSPENAIALYCLNDTSIREFRVSNFTSIRFLSNHNQFLATHFTTFLRLLILPQARDFRLPTLSATGSLSLNERSRSRSRIPYGACPSCGHSPHSLSLDSPQELRLSSQWWIKQWTAGRKTNHRVLHVGDHGAEHVDCTPES